MLARISPPEVLGDDPARHHLHPVLLDACFQSLLTRQIPADGDPAPGTGIRLPLSIAELSLTPVGDRTLWAHGVITRDDGDELVADLALYAEDGTPSAASPASAPPTSRRPPPPSPGPPSTPGWPSPSGPICRCPRTPGRPAEPGGDWLLFTDGDPGGVGAALAALVTGLGHRCRTVTPAAAYTRNAEGTAFTLAPDSADDLARLFADLDADTGPFRGTVVHLGGLALPPYEGCPRETLRQAAGGGAWGLVALAKVLQNRPAPGALHVVTRGAQPVTPGEAVEPLGAPAWGVTRVLRHQELTAHRGKLIDLDPAHDRSPAGAGPRPRRCCASSAPGTRRRSGYAAPAAPPADCAPPTTSPAPCRRGCAPTAATSSPAPSARWAACSAAPWSSAAPGTSC